MGQSKDTRPLHSRVDEALAALIKRGRPGQRLPAEPTLAAQLGVSRATLRETLRSFEERGLIARRHGAGTFIAPARPSAEDGLEVLESLERLANRAGLKIRMSAAVIEERPARPDELKSLGRTSATLVLAVARTITVKTQPVAHLVDIVPTEYLRKSDLGETFRGSLIEVFFKRGRPPLAYARTDLAATAAEAGLARQLQIQRGAPLLRLETQLYGQDNQIIGYSVNHFVPGSFRFHIIRRLKRAGSADPP